MTGPRILSRARIVPQVESTEPLTVTSAPAVGSVTTTGFTVRVSFSRIVDARIRVTRDLGAPTFGPIASGLTSPTLTITGLAPGATYAVHVVATSSDGETLEVAAGSVTMSGADLVIVSQPIVTELAATSLRISFEVETPVTAQTRITRVSDGRETFGPAETSFTYAAHSQQLDADDGLESGKAFELVAQGEAADGRRYVTNTVEVTMPSADAGGGTGGGGGGAVTGSATFAEIRSAMPGYTATAEFGAPGDARYVDKHVAEFLYQRPDVRYWEVSGETVTALATPVAPSSAIVLPAPSGGNDASAIRSALLANPGGSFTGRGRTYRIDGLVIDTAARIWEMPSRAISSGTVFDVRAADVRMIGCPIDGDGRNNLTYGWELREGADRFHLVDSGLSDVRITTKDSMSGVRNRGAKDCHFAGNAWADLINDTGNSTDSADTGRANPYWFNASNDANFGDAWIVNDTADNVQSDGYRDDAEFITVQNNAGTDGTIRIAGVRAVNCGKRFFKAQGVGGILACSNRYHWLDRQGPLGDRKQLCIMSNQFEGTSEVRAFHNRIVIDGAGEWDSLMTIENADDASEVRNVQFVANDVQINDAAAATYYAYGVQSKTGDTSLERGCRFAKNRLHGSGSISYLYEWRGGGGGSGWDLAGNTIDVTVDVRTTK